MSLSLKNRNICRAFYITSRHYSAEQKSIYQRDEEGPQERTVFGKPYPDWRKPWSKKEGVWNSKLALFIEKNPSPDILNIMQRVPYLTTDKVINWWADMKEIQIIQNQKFLPERVELLGSNLAALHYFTFRSAGVRLKGSKDWLCGPKDTFTLPNTYVEGYQVEAVDCSGFIKGGLRFEGFQNFKELNFLKWLSLKNNTFVDEWCLDRLAGLNGKSLEYLDITGCHVTAGFIYAIARMSELKVLILDDPGDNTELQAGLSLLEEERPNLVINAV